MNKAKRYSPEVRERAIRMAFEHEHDYSSRWAAIRSIEEKVGCTPETLRIWGAGRPIAPSIYYTHKAREADPALCSAQAHQNKELRGEIQRVW